MPYIYIKATHTRPRTHTHELFQATMKCENPVLACTPSLSCYRSLGTVFASCVADSYRDENCFAWMMKAVKKACQPKNVAANNLDSVNRFYCNCTTFASCH